MTTTSRGCGAGYDGQLLRRICLLLAQSGHPAALTQCPLLGVKRTSFRLRRMSAYDPKRTSVKTPLTALGMRSIYLLLVRNLGVGGGNVGK